MELIENMIFEGERPLYKSIKVEIKNKLVFMRTSN